jgi:predicted ribosome quality control (RQC) complex YloA/Tae2 family protein
LHRRLHGRQVRSVEVAGHTRLRLRWTASGEDLLVQLTPQFPLCLPVRPADSSAAADWLPCPAMEARIAGAVLTAVEKVPDDRVLAFRLGGGAHRFTLWAEIRPIAPALYLCDADDGILFALGALPRHLLRPPARYLATPRTGRMDPTADQLRTFLDAVSRSEWPSRLVRSFQRLSPSLVAEALARAGGGTVPGTVAAALAEVAVAAYQPAERFYLCSREPWPEDRFPLDPQRDIRLGVLPPVALTGWACQESPDLEPLLRKWWRYHAESQAFLQRKGELLHQLEDRARRLSGKIHALEQQLAGAEQAESLKRTGEIILANLHRFESGYRGDCLPAVDIFDPVQPEIRIQLDPGRTLPENAETYFRRSRKARQAASAVPERLTGARRRLEEIRALLAAARAALSAAELAPMTADTPAKRRMQRHSAAPAADRRLRRYQGHGGRTILVGRSAADNDYLSFRVGRPDDIWFHAADYSGSHVVLQWGRKEDPPLAALREAAALAAWYSGARKETSADVRWTRCKFVHKYKGAPGRVRLMKSHTLRVSPRLPEAQAGGD